MNREQGISKAGNRYLRALAIELAWSGVRRQPTSALSLWYRQRFASGGPRLRRIGIVALARKLLIALWRYLETGVVRRELVKPSPRASPAAEYLAGALRPSLKRVSPGPNYPMADRPFRTGRAP